MCGITGIFGKNIKQVKNRIIKMTDSVFHRGPDSGGIIVINDFIALGHRRLKILDLSNNANQPLFSNSERYGIVFNGEIYNFKELKLLTNYKYKTKSDTEVILAIIEEFGVEFFLKKANGMFAIGLYDLLKNKLYLLRDRLGIKPLFFFKGKKEFVFSSEIKAILKSGLVEAKFNEEAIDDYLGYRYVREPYTFFKGIYQVKAGNYIEVDENLLINKKKYWDLPVEFNYDKNYNEKVKIREFEKELKKAIRKRLIADVPLGTYLSGGVDSSLITAFVALDKSERINTYTIGFKELNEFEFAKIVADKYNTKHHPLEMDINKYLKKWNELIEFKDAPLGVPNEIPLAIMSKKLKKDIDVVLSGEGADELLGGYGKIFRSAFDYKNKTLSISFYDYFISNYEYVSRKIRDKYLNTNMIVRDEFDVKIKKEFSKHKNEDNIFRFFHKYHVKGLLQRLDSSTMYASVEARVPFLDHELIEYSYKNIPYKLKLKWNNKKAKEKAKKLLPSQYSEVLDSPKYILKKLACNYLPQENIDRKKVGFPVPLSEWFKDIEKIALKELKSAYWLDIDELHQLIKECKINTKASQILWMFINVEKFRKIYFNKEWRW